jgi:hypothetical protein
MFRSLWHGNFATCGGPIFFWASRSGTLKAAKPKMQSDLASVSFLVRECARGGVKMEYEGRVFLSLHRKPVYRHELARRCHRQNLG